MTWNFADSFDLYANISDMANGYWDGVTVASSALQTGRFSGSRALQVYGTSSAFVKSSGENDAVHHFVVSFMQSAAISGSTLGTYLELFDGSTAQCSIVFRSDGAILLTSGAPAGTVLATYTGAFSLINTWYAFEFEVVINNTTGSFTIRKNGNTVNDFSATALNTRGGTSNNYANKLQIGASGSVAYQNIDDVFWRADPSSIAWLGDIRCYTRMPASDASVQFTKMASTWNQTPYSPYTNQNNTNGWAFYDSIVAATDGTVGSLTISVGTGWTGNLKCAVFNSSGGAPSTVLATATIINNPTVGVATINFPTPFTVSRGSTYWVGYVPDASSGAMSVGNNNGKLGIGVSYASFPAASPSLQGGSSAGPAFTWVITLATNASVVGEPQQDGATSYVYDSTPGDADLYGLSASIGSPAVIATVTRAYMMKSDAGTRTAAVQVKSGGTTVASPTLTLSSSTWQWAWRMDLVDPATSAAWTASAVDSVQIGPKVIA